MKRPDVKEYKFKLENILYWIQPSCLNMNTLWAKTENDITWNTIITGGQNTFQRGCPHCQTLMAHLVEQAKGEKVSVIAAVLLRQMEKKVDSLSINVSMKNLDEALKELEEGGEG